MKKFLIAAAAVAASIQVVPTLAADMPVKASVVGPFNWTGWYIGLNEGGALDNSKVADPFVDPVLGVSHVFGDQFHSRPRLHGA